MNVLIIPEDFRKDQYIVKPIVGAMLAAAGKPNARIRVCMEPILGGIDQALRWSKIEEILDRYRGMVHLFLLLVDRDGDESRRSRLDSIEQRATMKLEGSPTLLAENAWQELEVWVLAGHTLPAEWRWTEIRAALHPKEQYFDLFSRDRGLSDEPGGGRKTLGREAAANYQRVRQLCVEDVQTLEQRVKSACGAA